MDRAGDTAAVRGEFMRPSQRVAKQTRRGGSGFKNPHVCVFLELDDSCHHGCKVLLPKRDGRSSSVRGGLPVAKVWF